MAINSNSRYQFSAVDFIQKDINGPVKPIVFYSPDELSEVDYVLHVFAEGQTLHQLSWQFYDRPDFWWAIVEYNPEIEDHFNIQPGTYLRIPRV